MSNGMAGAQRSTADSRDMGSDSPTPRHPLPRGTSIARPVARSLGVLIGAIALTWLVRQLADDTMYVFLLAAIAVVAWKDGWKVAAAAAALSIAAVDLIFIEPGGALRPLSLAAGTQLVSFGLVATLIIAVTHALREAELRADHHAHAAERALSAAEEVGRAREGFLRTLTHEVRTPINAVLGYADLLGSEVGGPINPAQAMYVRRLQLAARHLQTVANGALEIARADAGHRKLDRRRIRVAASVDTAIAMVEPQAKAKRLTILVDRINLDLVYVGDADCVQQILVNLLGNAVKFTPGEGTIHVVTGVAPVARLTQGRLAKPVYVRVADSGPGIAPEDQERIFEPFERTAQRSGAASEGAGLGLAISRRLARLMGGEITVDSQPDHGASFTLWLPGRDDVAKLRLAAAE
jgi:signal transduction histidine kinase